MHGGGGALVGRFLIGDLGLVRPENPHFRAVGLSGGFLRTMYPIV